MEYVNLILSALSQGMLYAPMAMGVFIAFKILNTPDLTIDGSLVFGMTVCAVVTIGSLGIAGIPGTATMAASVALSGVGMASQFAMVSPILAIDPIIDMPRTMLNVTGSLTNALVVDKHMGTFDEKAYNDLSLNTAPSKTK